MRVSCTTSIWPSTPGPPAVLAWSPALSTGPLPPILITTRTVWSSSTPPSLILTRATPFMFTLQIHVLIRRVNCPVTQQRGKQRRSWRCFPFLLLAGPIEKPRSHGNFFWPMRPETASGLPSPPGNRPGRFTAGMNPSRTRSPSSFLPKRDRGLGRGLGGALARYRETRDPALEVASDLHAEDLAPGSYLVVLIRNDEELSKLFFTIAPPASSAKTPKVQKHTGKQTVSGVARSEISGNQLARQRERQVLMKIMTMLAVVLFCIGPAAGSPAAAQTRLSPRPRTRFSTGPGATRSKSRDRGDVRRSGHRGGVFSTGRSLRRYRRRPARPFSGGSPRTNPGIRCSRPGRVGTEPGYRDPGPGWRGRVLVSRRYRGCVRGDVHRSLFRPGKTG